MSSSSKLLSETVKFPLRRGGGFCQARLWTKKGTALRIHDITLLGTQTFSLFIMCLGVRRTLLLLLLVCNACGSFCLEEEKPFHVSSVDPFTCHIKIQRTTKCLQSALKTRGFLYEERSSAACFCCLWACDRDEDFN